MAKLAPGLVKAVKEYHKWHGGKNIVPVRIVQNKHSKPPYELVLARFTDGYGDEMSCLMEFQGWKDGHYDVEETDVVERKDEASLVEEFEESMEFEFVNEDDFMI